MTLNFRNVHGPATPKKQHLICREYSVRAHVPPECIFSMRDHKQVAANFETLTHAERVAV